MLTISTIYSALRSRALIVNKQLQPTVLKLRHEVVGLLIVVVQLSSITSMMNALAIRAFFREELRASERRN
jgi:hypothetical protein